MSIFISHNENETINFAKDLASILTVGDIIVLSGDLGSGKTKFTQGFLSYFGLENEISSPTFTIVNEYNTNSFPIFHFDVYRLSSVDEFYAIGGTDYFDKGICIIEWGEIIKDALPNDHIQIIFSRDSSDENIRNLSIQVFGNRLKDKIKNII